MSFSNAKHILNLMSAVQRAKLKHACFFNELGKRFRFSLEHWGVLWEAFWVLLEASSGLLGRSVASEADLNNFNNIL